MFSCRFLLLASFDVPVSHLQRRAGDLITKWQKSIYIAGNSSLNQESSQVLK